MPQLSRSVFVWLVGRDSTMGFWEIGSGICISTAQRSEATSAISLLLCVERTCLVYTSARVCVQAYLSPLFNTCFFLGTMLRFVVLFSYITAQDVDDAALRYRRSGHEGWAGGRVGQ